MGDGTMINEKSFGNAGTGDESRQCRERGVYDGKIHSGWESGTGDRGRGCFCKYKKKFSDSCHYYHVPYAEYGDKDKLGNAVGKSFRASMAVTDKGFAASIGKNLNLEVTKYGKNEDL